jgi:hypothetical protein
VELGYSGLTRRERIERIATAERDRRAGRIDVAVAALGEASEWPARVVLALAKLPEFEAAETRRILEEGLDLWIDEVGLSPLDEPSEPSGTRLDSPIEPDELERAFAQAEAQTDEMHDANRVAERVLMDEPIGLAELGEDPLLADEVPDLNDVVSELAMDAAEIDDLAILPDISGSADTKVLATLERWLQNLQSSSGGRAK